MIQRPTSVTILGIINIAFAALGFVGVVFMLAFDAPVGQSEFFGVWTTVTQVLGFIANFALLAAGIGLLAMRPWGRVLSIGYAGYAIIMALLSTAVAISMMRAQTQGMGGSGADPQAIFMMAMVGGLIGLGISLIHPTLLWYFLTRPHVIAAFDGISLPTAEETPFEPQQRIASDNPYATPVTLTGIPSGASPHAGEQVLETVVPINNRPALLSYYTGLFSLFPVLGLPLAIVAIISGRRGLKNVKANPEVHGKAHAWVGLVCGWLFGLFNLVLTGAIGVGIFVAITSKG